jgi:hypothetical protein
MNLTKFKKAMQGRHLRDAGAGAALCGGEGRAVHTSKARRTDCGRCRVLARLAVLEQRARELAAGPLTERSCRAWAKTERAAATMRHALIIAGGRA